MVVVDPATLEDVAIIDRPVRMAMAVTVGTTRLIDNMPLTP
jgi:pantothenate synthetase